jgi:hypothetical protein
VRYNMRKLILAIFFISCAVSINAQNTATVQMQLVNSPVFTNRIQFLLTQQAVTVMSEPIATGGACHGARLNYAGRVISNPAAMTPVASVVIVTGTNLTSVAVTGSGVTADSAATDAAIASQISTFWNALSNCGTGT